MIGIELFQTGTDPLMKPRALGAGHLDPQCLSDNFVDETIPAER